MSMSDFYLDRLNWANDPRNRGKAKTPELWTEDEDGNEVRIELPTHWEVCPVCDGEGKHVNPSIDCGGISGDQFDDDPEFWESYQAGVFDVVCYHCEGLRVVRAVDWDRLTDEQRRLLEEQEQADAEYEAERRAEFIMGC